MNEPNSPSYTTFDGFRRIAAGPLAANAKVFKRAHESGAGPLLIFDDATGRAIDVDIRGSEEEMVARLAAIAAAGERSAPGGEPAGEPEAAAEGSPGRGRPKLGVVPREVTLLPRHWEWLATQPGGASVALRKLVEAARRTSAEGDRTRRAQERAYHFMVAIAGNLPYYEEATRALFAGDRPRFGELIAEWPEDVREHAARLAFEGGGDGDSRA